MLAFGTDYDYYNAVWVKNEWSRYLKLMAKDKEKHLIPCYKDIDAYDIPKEFKHLQAQDMGKVGADQDLLRGIDKILKPEGSTSATGTHSSSDQQDIQKAVASAMASNMNSNVSALLERGFMTLEDGDFEKADGLFEDVLNQNPKCEEAYMGKLMAYYKFENAKKFAEELFKRFFSELEEEKIELDYDIQDLLEKHYTLSDMISESAMKSIRKNFNVRIKTNIACLNQYNDGNDYIKKYCMLDNCSSKGSEQDDKYYQRYLQYATEESKNRFNIHKILQDMVASAKAVEDKKVSQIRNKYSRDNVVKLIELADEKAKSIVGDALEQIESEYQLELSKWQKECEEITNTWPQKRQQIQTDWKAECDAIKHKYEKDKKEVEENNQKVQQSYQQAVSQYEEKITRIDDELSRLRDELEGLGLFQRKQKVVVLNNIMILENEKNSLKLPILTDYGKMMMEPRLILPEQPLDNEKPILPEKPIRKEMNQNVYAADILFDEFEKEEIALGRRIIELGSYKGSPISWIVLEKKDGKALLLSEYALDAIPYHEKLEETTWEQCTLRSWLNNDFLNEALATEKHRICTTNVTADANPEYDTNPGNDTNDKIFLLSINEVEKYFSEVEERMCYPTKYAKTTKLNVVDDNTPIFLSFYGACEWWLRSPGDYTRGAARGCPSGDIDMVGMEVDEEFVGVRPALWIELES